MKKIIPFLIACTFGAAASAQFTYKIKADSLLVTNDSCSAEFNLENSTKSVKGFLYNKGNGRTEFRKGMINRGDTMYIFGNDTLKATNLTIPDAWKLTGNTGTNSSTNFIGTVDNQKLVFKTNNVQRMAINLYENTNSGGEVVIGPGNPDNLFSLTVKESGVGRAGIKIDGSNSSPNPGLLIYSSNSNHYYANITMQSPFWGTSYFNQYEGMTYSVDSQRHHRWFTGTLERMKLSTDGELRIATTTDAGNYKLQVAGNTWSSGIAQYSNTAFQAPNVKIGYDGTNSEAIYITGNTIECPVIKLDNVAYAIATGKGVIDIVANHMYMYGSSIDGSGAALRYTVNAFNPGGLKHFGTFINMQDTASGDAGIIYGHTTLTKSVNGDNYAYYADASLRSGGTGTAYAFYANAGQSLLKDKLTINGPNGYSQLKLVGTYTPSSTSDTNGDTGSVAWDSNYIYIKTASGWKRSALSTF